MIIFLFGESTFLSKEKLKNIKDRYISASLGDTNLGVVEGAEASFSQIQRQINTSPFLAKTRLVIIKEIISENPKLAEEILPIVKNKPESTVLLFWEGKTSKKNKLLDYLKKQKQVQEFKKTSELEVKKWAENRLGKDIKDKKVIAKIIGKVDLTDDLWKIDNNIEKFILYYLETGEILDIDKKDKVDGDIFNLVDLIIGKNEKDALKRIEKYKETGEYLMIFSMIASSLRNIMIIRELIDDDKNPSYDKVLKSGVKWFVYKKNLSFARKYDLVYLKNAFKRLLELDKMIKTGQLNAKMALNLFVFEFCQDRC